MPSCTNYLYIAKEISFISTRMLSSAHACLPLCWCFCPYQPGNWRDKKVIEDRKNADGCTWVAFYADVRHEVSEVEEGFCVVLNYCLSFDGAMSPSSMLPIMDPFGSAIIINYFSAGSKKILAIPLRYEYTQASLSANFLKGIDAMLWKKLLFQN